MTKWKLNGTELGDATTTVVVTAYSYDGNVRQGTVSLHGGGEYAEALGVDYDRADITFTIIGATDARFDWVAIINGIVKSTAKWDLQVPAGSNMRIIDDFEVGVFGTEGRPKTTVVDRAKTTITVPAILFGAPGWAGGTFVDCQNLEVEFVNNDFYATTGDAAYADGVLIGAPEQKTGYPKAVNTTTGAKEALPLLGSFVGSNSDGTTSTVEVYDAAGYVFGEPQTAGNAGPATVCFCAERSL